MSIESSTALTSKAVTTTRSGRQTGLESSSSAATFESSTSSTADTVTKAEASKVENNRATTNDDFEPPLRPRVLALSGNKGTTTGTTGTSSAAAVKPTLSRSSNTRAAVDTRSQSPERGTTDRFGKADDTEIEPESPRTQELSYFLRTQVGSNEHKPPRVGSNFQVNIDEFVLTPAATDMHSESGYIQTRSSSDVSANDGLVWQPEAVSEEYLATYVMAVDDCVSEVKESFLRRKSSDSLKPCKDGQIFINGSYVLMKSRLEDLHYDTLHQCEYKADDAVELLSALQDEIFVEWTHQEQAIFRSLFNKYGDNLYKIADSLENKTRNDVIEYFFRSIYSAVQLEDVNLESFVPDMSTLLGPLSPSEDSAKPNESSALATSGASNMQSESEGVRQSAFGKDTMDLGLDELNVAKSSHDTGSHNGLMPGSNRPDAKKQSEIDSESDDESESEQAAVDSVDKVNSLRLREVGGDEKTNSQLKDVETTDADANIDSKRAPKKSKLKFVDGQPPNSFKPSHDDDNDDGNDNNHPDNGNARKGTTSTAGNNIPIHFQNSSGQQQQSTQQSSHAVSGNKTSDLGTSAPNSLKSIGESLQKQKQKQKQQSLEALRRSSVRFKSPAQTFMPLSRLREPSITTQEDNSTSTEGGMTTASDSMKALVEVEQVGSLTASESATWSKNTIKTEVTPSIYEQSSITEELTTTSESFESSVDLNLNSAQDTVTTASTADTDLSVLPVVEPVQPPISTVAQEHTIDRVSDVKETAVSQIYLPPLPVQAPRSFVVGYSSWHGNVEASLVPIKPPGPVKPAGPPTGVLYPTSASGSSKMYYNASVGDTSGSFQSSYLNDFSKGDDPSRIGGTYMIQKKNLNGSVYSTTPNSIGAYNAASFASSIEPNRQYQIPIDLSAYPVTSTMPYRDNPYSKMSNEHLRSINAINKLRLLNRKVEQNKSGISEFTTTKPKKSTVASNSLKASQNMLRLNLGSEESSKLLDKIKNIGRTTVSDKVALEYNSITASTKKRSYVKSENYSKGKILSSHQGSMTESQLNNASQHSKLKPKKQGNASTGNPYQCKSHDSGQNAPIRRGRPLGSGRKAPVIAKSLVSNSTKMKMDRNNVMVFLTR